MAQLHADIAIFGAGIAGLWLLNRLRAEGYNAVLFEKNAIGSGQTIASQGIIHSGLKYKLAGKISEVARQISLMPERWRSSLAGNGEVDLTQANISTDSQLLIFTQNLFKGMTDFAAGQALDDGGQKLKQAQWPQPLIDGGFDGAAFNMEELVLDIPSIINALAEPHRDYIYKLDHAECEITQSSDGCFIKSSNTELQTKMVVFTSAKGNQEFSESQKIKLKTQHRPLVMTMFKDVPFDLYMHFAAYSEKPMATITTHRTVDGKRVWYVGGYVAEHDLNKNPNEVREFCIEAFKKYLPHIDAAKFEWATLPIDRVEAKKNKKWSLDPYKIGLSLFEKSLPPTAIIKEDKNILYGWPTKLTFAPLLADMVIEKINAKAIEPSKKTMEAIHLPRAEYAKTPWDEVEWKSGD